MHNREKHKEALTSNYEHIQSHAVVKDAVLRFTNLNTPSLQQRFSFTHPVRFEAVNVDDVAHPTGIGLLGGVIQALGGRKTWTGVREGMSRHGGTRRWATA